MEHDLYAVDFKKPVRKTTRNRETAMRKHGKVYHVTEYNSKPMNKNKVNDVVCSGHRLPPKQVPKAVDEDLYKISPQLLRTTNKKKMLGFISKCLCFS